MKKSILEKLIGILIIISIWSFIAYRIEIFPSLIQIICNFFTNLVDLFIITSVFNTIIRAIFAFVISLILGVILANIAFKYNFFKNVINPMISLLRSIPTISIILVVIMLVKIELITYIIVLIIIVPIIYQSVLFSLENIDKELLLINKLDNCSPVKNYFLFTFPMSYSGILNAILQTFGLSIKIQIMSELLTGSTKLKGIGTLLNFYKNNLELDNMFSITLVIIIIVYIFEYFLKLLIKRVNI